MRVAAVLVLGVMTLYLAAFAVDGWAHRRTLDDPRQFVSAGGGYSVARRVNGPGPCCHGLLVEFGEQSRALAGGSFSIALDQPVLAYGESWGTSLGVVLPDEMHEPIGWWDARLYYSATPRPDVGPQSFYIYLRTAGRAGVSLLVHGDYEDRAYVEKRGRDVVRGYNSISAW